MLRHIKLTSTVAATTSRYGGVGELLIDGEPLAGVLSALVQVRPGYLPTVIVELAAATIEVEVDGVVQVAGEDPAESADGVG